MRLHPAIGLLATTALCAPGLVQAQTAPAPANDAEYQLNVGLGMIDTLAANLKGYTGKGVLVAIVDDGLDVLHPEFAERISDERLSTDKEAANPQDVAHRGDAKGNITEAHGTHVAGIIAAARDGVTGIYNMQRADLGWRHAFGDVTPEMTLALADGTAFDARGTPVAHNAALIGAGGERQDDRRLLVPGPVRLRGATERGHRHPDLPLLSASGPEA